MKSRQEQQPLLPNPSPFYDGIFAIDKEDDSTRHLSSNLRQFSLGIFQVAYSARPRFSATDTIKTFRELWHLAPYAGRLLAEMYAAARAPVVLYLLASTVIMASPAASLLLLASILRVAEKIVVSPEAIDPHINALRALVLKWLFIGILNSLAHRARNNAASTLSGHLRAHFLPQLVQASLRLDVTTLRSMRALRSLPSDGNYDLEVPGNVFFDEINKRLWNTLTVLALAGVLLLVIFRRGVYEARLIVFFTILPPAVMFLKPTTGTGGAGYVFWTENKDYYYLAALYRLAFAPHFRKTLARDGMCAYIAEEYRRVSEALGSANVPALMIGMYMQVQWYWLVVQSLVVDHPLPICALMLPWADPVSSLVTILFIQHATGLLKQSIEQLKYQSTKSLIEVLEMAKDLYEGIELESTLNSGTEIYQTEKQGMKISFRNVSCSRGRWLEEPSDAVTNVSFEIPDGSLVLIVGNDHAGKTRICSLIQRLEEPSAGEILIDDKPIAEYDVASLREAMACVAQDEEMYPLPLWQNMTVGADLACLDKAAEMSCATKIVDNFPRRWDTTLEPAWVAVQSVHGCEHGIVSGEAIHELEVHGPNFQQIPVNGREKQKLAATRMFSRLLQLKDKVKLMIWDEAMGAMEPCAEQWILERSKEAKKGKTAIFVAQRFVELAHMADIILVMDGGRLVQHGAHKELIDFEDGKYAQMYNAQKGA